MRFELIVLGSSAAVPALGRHCSGQLLCLESSNVLFDCGEATQQQLQRTGESPGRLDLILITHLHGDHYFGLPGLLTSMALAGRKAPLVIVSPPGLRDRMAVLLEYDKYAPPFNIDFIEIHCEEPTVLIDLPAFTVTGFPLDHRIKTNGYLLREKQRPANILPEKIKEFSIPYKQIPGIKAGDSFLTNDGRTIPHEELTRPASPPRAFAYCSDTLFKPELAKVIRGVDLLYHEATFLHEDLEKALKTNHSTALQAGEMASLAKTKQLLIGHFSARYHDLEPLRMEAAEKFRNTHLARELYHYPVALRRANHQEH
ncbi:ribonuclease [Lewinellaceae bacterium SD302]|nr:ribonuclease [Lewinellaceae bacterium SD302]